MTDWILQARGLTRRYGRRLGLADCTLSVPSGRVVGLVGPNGAGKTTLLHLAVGLLAPSSGTVEVLGERPGYRPAHLARVGFVAHDAPLYPRHSVAAHLRMGALLNPRWDMAFAAGRVRRLGLDPRQRAGRLSAGQRAQLALTLAMAKRPELLILDEPAASLDPIARRDFLDATAEVVAEHGTSVVFSSHLVGDLERICDYLVILVASRVRAAGPVADLLARLSGGAQAEPGFGGAEHPPRGPEPVALEDLVLAYLREPEVAA